MKFESFLCYRKSIKNSIILYKLKAFTVQKIVIESTFLVFISVNEKKIELD